MIRSGFILLVVGSVALSAVPLHPVSGADRFGEAGGVSDGDEDDLKELERTLRDNLATRQKAFDAHPDDAKTRFDLGEAHARLGEALGASGKGEAAIESLSRAIDFLPYRSTLYLQLGVNFRALGKLNEAEKACRRAIELDPESGAAHNLLGDVLFDLGRMDDAVDAYRKAAEAEPDSVEARDKLAKAIGAKAELEGTKDTDLWVGGYRKAIPISGRPGMYRSPHGPEDELIDARGLKSGTRIRCPFSSKVIVIP